MLKAKTQHNQTQSQPAVQRARGRALGSPHGECIAQLETVRSNSQHTAALFSMKGVIENSARMANQRKAIKGIQSRTLGIPQRREIYNHVGQTVQRRELKDAASFGGLRLHDTGETFSVVGQYGKDDASWYADDDSHEADTKSEAMSKVAARAGEIGEGTQVIGSEETQGKGKRARRADPKIASDGYFTSAAYYARSDVDAIDPFTHGSYCLVGDTDYIVTMYQHTHDLDGYVTGIEEGTVGEGREYERAFAETMTYGQEKATASVADVSESYSNVHDQTGGNTLLDIAESPGEGKSDAIAKLTGEGARFEWVRNNIDSMTDDTEFQASPVDSKPQLSIKFKDLWCVWKGWFGGAYNIKDATIDGKLKQKGHAEPPSREAKRRILFDGEPYRED